MPYNYAYAFREPSALLLTPQKRKEIAATAIIFFRMEFPEVDYVKVRLLVETKHVEVESCSEYRVYSWKQLGFEL